MTFHSSDDELGKNYHLFGANKINGNIWLLHDMKRDWLHRLSDIRTVELVRLQQAGHVGSVGETRNAQQVLI